MEQAETIDNTLLINTFMDSTGQRKTSLEYGCLFPTRLGLGGNESPERRRRGAAVRAGDWRSRNVALAASGSTAGLTYGTPRWPPTGSTAGIRPCLADSPSRGE